MCELPARFETLVLPHVPAGARLARRLMPDVRDAEDVVQEACLRAFRYFHTFIGGDSRAWFLCIVRNTCYGWRHQAPADPFDEEQHGGPDSQPDPETLLLQADDRAPVARALRRLPDRFHQLLLLREFEGLSYRELAAVTQSPIGTVMSRLSRARAALRRALDEDFQQPVVSARTRPREQEAPT